METGDLSAPPRTDGWDGKGQPGLGDDGGAGHAILGPALAAQISA